MRSLNYDVMYSVEDEHWWFVGRRAIVFAQIDAALGLRAHRPFARSRCADESDPPARGQVLDIGCGTGANLAPLRRYGHVQAVDVSHRALAFCRRRGETHLFCASATALPFAGATFDLVTALDVIEHLDDDLQGLREIRRVLRAGAPAVLFVPAFQSLWGPNDDQSGHRRRYRLGALRARVEAAGLRVEHISYANIAMFGPIWLGRKVLNRLGRHAQSENRINHPLVNGLLGRLFASEAGWLRRHSLPFGVSIVCVARNPSDIVR